MLEVQTNAIEKNSRLNLDFFVGYLKAFQSLYYIAPTAKMIDKC
jgi:hypothetical protein